MENENLAPVDLVAAGKKKKQKVILALVILALIILLIISVSVYLFFKLRLLKAGTRRKVQVLQAQQTVAKQTEQKFYDDINKTYAVDKDFDGISDQDEKKYGTSSTSSDTDGDGILDQAEINIYKTNPLKADTDGDGYQDGYEVRRGYNPNGSGKL